MRRLRQILGCSALFLSFNTNAILLTDTIHFNEIIPKDGWTPPNGWVGHIFEFIPLGYIPSTDTITRVKLIYDFTEIYSLTNEGDDEDYNDPDYPMSDGPIYEDEPVTISSWIFNYKDYHPDVDTGLIVYETDWTRTDYCQFEAFGIPSDDSTVYCLLNLDLFGNMNAGVLSYSNNLMLNSITAEIEFTRKESVPEPNSVLLFGLALFGLGLKYRKTKRQEKMV